MVRKGNSTQGQYPILAGQTSRYIYLQLKDFKEGRRSDPHMTSKAKDLSREDMFDLAAYFSAQKPVGDGVQARSGARGQGQGQGG